MQINEDNYEDLMLSWLDGELKGPGLDAMKQFLRDHPEKKKELETLRMTILPQEAMRFPGRHSLYRRRKAKWFLLAPAAVAAVLLTLFLLPSRSPSVPRGGTVAATTRPSAPNRPGASLAHTGVVKPAAPHVPLAGATPTREHKVVSAVRFPEAAGTPALSHPVPQRQDKSSHTAENRTPENERSPAELPPLGHAPDLHVPRSVPLAATVPALPPALPSGHPDAHQASERRAGKVTIASIGEVRQKMDHTLTEKIGEIQYKISHPFDLLKGREIRIGNVSFAFNK